MLAAAPRAPQGPARTTHRGSGARVAAPLPLSGPRAENRRGPNRRRSGLGLRQLHRSRPPLPGGARPPRRPRSRQRGSRHVPGGGEARTGRRAGAAQPRSPAGRRGGRRRRPRQQPPSRPARTQSRAGTAGGTPSLRPPPRRPITARNSRRAPPPGLSPRQSPPRRASPFARSLRAPATAPPPSSTRRAPPLFAYSAPPPYSRIPRPATFHLHTRPRPPVPSGRYCAMMVTVCPARFSAAAACSWVALRRFTPFTCGNSAARGLSALSPAPRPAPPYRRTGVPGPGTAQPPPRPSRSSPTGCGLPSAAPR